MRLMLQLSCYLAYALCKGVQYQLCSQRHQQQVTHSTQRVYQEEMFREADAAVDTA